MKRLLLFSFMIISASPAFSQDWATNVANIIYTNCSKCHHPQGIAEFSLMSYFDAVDESDDIKDAVLSHEMPPWPPDPDYSRLAHERILSQQQIDDIVAWVDNGTPRGDSTLEPAAPVIATAHEISSPDLVINAPVYQVNTTSDLYRCFVIPTNLSTEQYITILEAVPGDRSVVHHILIYSDTTNTPAFLDALDPDPGYTNFGGTGSFQSQLIGAWVPGQGAFYSPNGMGIRLPANGNIILQVHYPGGISNRVDSSKVLLKLTPTPQRDITIDSPLNHYQLDNGPLMIPANTMKTFYAHQLVQGDVSVLGVGPHMHLIGKSIKSFGVTITGDTIPFIDIPEWDFHWQGVYMFPKILKVPAMTTIYSEALYDNTSANDENPNSPPQDVSLGESTTDEMMLVYFAYTDYMAGDENIVIDSSLISGIEEFNSTLIKSLQLYDPMPNPSRGMVSFQYYLPAKGDVSVSIIDTKGNTVREMSDHFLSAGLVTRQISTETLPAGIYLLNVESNGVKRTKRLVVNN